MKQFLLFVIFSCSFLQNNECEARSSRKINELNKVSHEVIIPILYPDVTSILKVVEDPQNIGHRRVQDLLNFYYAAQMKKDQFISSGGIRKYPLIVVEGLAGSGKTTTSTALAEKINGTQVHSPLLQVKKLQKSFSKNPIIFNAYHQLSHYITASDIYPLLKDGPVVLDRFWPSSTTYSIARTVFYSAGKSVMPPNGDKIYEWPNDLLKPDIVFFLDVEEEERHRRITNRNNKPRSKLGKNEIMLHSHPEYRKNVILAYKNLENPHVTFVNDNVSQKEVVENMYSKLKYLLHQQ